MDGFNQSVIREFRANHGKVGGQMQGMQVLLLTTTGAKTGPALTWPLVYTRDDGRIVIAASHGGSDHNPPWHHNPPQPDRDGEAWRRKVQGSGCRHFRRRAISLRDTRHFNRYSLFS